MKLKQTHLAILIVLMILIIDQISKIYIKTSMVLGQEYHVFGNWFIIHFTENNGMAFGMEFGGNAGKIALSIFRILAIIGIGYYIYRLSKKNTSNGLIICLSLIMAGALGNIVDSIFYGVIFTDSYGQIATMFPEAGGYAPLLQGKVVDMFYFPIIEGHYPSWFPFWANQEFVFFRPVFNVADSAITTGVLLLILFQWNHFTKK